MTILQFHLIILKNNKKIKNSMRELDNQENHRTPRENTENHENHENPLKKNEN